MLAFFPRVSLAEGGLEKLIRALLTTWRQVDELSIHFLGPQGVCASAAVVKFPRLGWAAVTFPAQCFTEKDIALSTVTT
eukprot:4170347-Amphidinium_carterae.2